MKTKIYLAAALFITLSLGCKENQNQNATKKEDQIKNLSKTDEQNKNESNNKEKVQLLTFRVKSGQQYGVLNIDEFLLTHSLDSAPFFSLQGEQPFEYSVGTPTTFRSNAVGSKVFDNLGCISSAPWSAKSGFVRYQIPSFHKDCYLVLRYSKNTLSNEKIVIEIGNKQIGKFYLRNQFNWNLFDTLIVHLNSETINSEY